MKFLSSSDFAPAYIESRMKYITIFYFTFIFLISYFFFRVYSQTDSTDNQLMILLAFVFFLLSPVTYKISKNYAMSALQLFFSSAFIGSFLIYLAGGLKAPGVFWITALPFIGGITLKKRGVIAGIISIVVIITVFLLCDYLNLRPLLNLEADNYQYEKNLNLLLFTIFQSLIFLYFIRTEEIAQKLNIEQKGRIETLLRVLFRDIGNPLTYVNAKLSMMQTSDVKQDDLKKINKQITNCVDILSEVRKMKSISDGKTKINLEPLHLAPLIHQAVDLTLDRLNDKGLTYKIDLCKEDHLVNLNETIFVNQVLINILSNAIKFSQRNSEIHIHCSAVDKNLELSIKDFGVGIPQTLVSTIFEINEKTSRCGTEGETGTGFGMIIVKEYMNSFSGEIKIVSTEGQGTEIKLIVPIYIQ